MATAPRAAAAAAPAPPSDADAADAVPREPGTGDADGVRPAVVRRLDLDVEAPPSRVLRLLVLDARIREVHLLVEVRQVVFSCLRGHLGCGAFAMAVVAVAVAVVPPLLVLALQLVVEHDPPHSPAALLDGASCVLIGAMNMDVVFELPRPLDARVEGLGPLEVGRPVPLQEPGACGRQSDRMVTRARQTLGLDQPLLAQVAQVAGARVRRRTAGVQEITTGDHPKRTDRGQGARLGSTQRVLAATGVVHDFAFRPARQLYVALEHVPRWAVTVTPTDVAIALTQVHHSLASGLSLTLSAARAATKRWPCVGTATLALTGSVLGRQPLFVSIVEVPGIEIHGTPLPHRSARSAPVAPRKRVTNW